MLNPLKNSDLSLSMNESPGAVPVSDTESRLRVGLFYMEGWIKLHRKITEHWIWQDPVKFQWWIDILIEVNHKEVKVPIGFNLITCGRGQSVRSLGGWGRRWKVSRDTARNFLKMLEKDTMISHEVIYKTTRITVCNYDTYQTTLHDESRILHASHTHASQIPHTNKNEKNEKKIVEKEINKEKENGSTEQAEPVLKEKLMANLPSIEELKALYAKEKNSSWVAALLLSKHMYTELLKKYPDHNTILGAKINRWVTDADLLLRVDKIDIKKAGNTFNFAMKDPFWTSIVRSPANLRKNFDSIRAKMDNPQQKPNTPPPTPTVYKTPANYYTEERIEKERKERADEWEKWNNERLAKLEKDKQIKSTP